MVEKTEWLLCPYCKGKTRNKLREDTVLQNFPLFCPKCKHEYIVNVKKFHIEIIESVRYATPVLDVTE